MPPHIVLDQEQTTQRLAQTQADLERLRPGAPSERPPYLGLSTFQERDADLFFGREALVADLVARVEHTSFLAVLGASGSGKSSVVRAGLIPELKGGALPGSERWRYTIFKPGDRPLDALAAALAKLQGTDLGSALSLRDQLIKDESSLLFAARMLLDGQDDARLVLVVDQAEELWTLAPADQDAHQKFIEEQQHPFIRVLLTATESERSPILTVLTLRADFLHRAIEQRPLSERIERNVAFVSPMQPDELCQAILGPAASAGVGFEPGLVDELIEQTAGREGALPLLEYTLLELWKAKQPEGTLTWQAFKELGEVAGALAARADAILAEHFPTEAQQDELRTLLLRLVQPGEGTTDTRRRVLLEDLVPAGGNLADLQGLLNPLVEARLLVISGSAGSEHGRTNADTQAQADGERSGEYAPDLQSLAPATVEIAHEVLIRAWPTLRKWIDEDRANVLRQIQLAEAAREWEVNGAGADFLWSGRRLEQVEAWVIQARPRLNQRDRSFLDASRAAEQQRVVAEQAAQQREQAQAQQVAAERIARRQLRQVVGGAIGSGLGYSVGLLYLTIAASAGALLTGASPVTWDTALLFLFQFATAGAFVGPVIVIALQRQIQSDWRTRLITPLFGALPSAIPMLVVVLSFTRPADLTLGLLTRTALAGALIGAGLGIGAGVATDKWRQFGAIVLAGMLAVVLAYVLVGVPARDLPTALIGGAILGGLTAAGFLITAADGNWRSRKEDSHGSV